MATNVVRGAGRARHERNRKHQQHTPLPPKQGQVAKAKAVVEEAAQAAKPQKPTGNSKADALVAHATATGWEVTGRTVDGSNIALVFERGSERITGSWTNGVWDYPGHYENGGGGSRVLLNASAARKAMSTPATEVRHTPAKAAREPGAAPTKAKTTVVKVPFNANTSSDNEVLTALRGHRIKWTNKFSELVEVGVVPINGNKTKLHDDDLDDPGTRQLTFCDAAGEGYRTVRLSSIVYVSPHEVKEAIEDDIEKRARENARRDKAAKKQTAAEEEE